ncbi:MAG TPA: DUF1501 domain-containing protein, partial [Planctomycetaceae bacterium]|nr:DUF1501 domain-containing protein [Planctomycetaceae bacterium]
MLSLDQLNRRQAVRVGTGSLLGLSLGDLLRADAKQAPQARSVIHLYLTGGFSVQESWDPKPEAPTDFRGSFDVVRTNRGDHFSENFPRMAAVADKMTVIRSMHCKIP